MSGSSSISTYAIRVREKRKADYLDLCSLPTEKIDLLDLIFDALNSARDKNIQNELGSVYKIKLLNKKDRSISGIISVGKDGSTSEIIDTKSLKRTYDKKADEAEILPFYFNITVPIDLAKGFFVVQKDSLYGAKIILEDIISSLVKDKLPNLIIEFNPFVPEEWVEEYFRGKTVKKVSFISETIPVDIANAINSDFKRTEGSFEFSVIAKKGKSLPIVNKLVSSYSKGTSPKGFLEFNSLDFNNVKLEVESPNGKSKVFDWLNPSNRLFDEDISRKVEYGVDGHVKFESIDDFVLNKISSIIKSIGR